MTEAASAREPTGTLAQGLSGGNRRKLSAAIALLGAPSVVILDEPTAALDTKMKHHVLKLIAKLIQNRTLVMITHDQSLLSYCDRRIHLDKGRLV